MGSGKLSVKTKLGYGIGQLGDSIGYNVFYIYFLFFLTDVAGVSPAVAGSVSLIAVLWDAFTDPIIGYFSDNSRSIRGRRRPFMIAGSIPYAICMFLLFSDINLSGAAKGIYFVIIAMAFWTCYTVYVIPFFALGGELTSDFGERTSVRAWASMFMYLAVLIASAAPPLIVDYVQTNMGGTAVSGYRGVGLLFGIIIFIVIVVCWLATKGKEPAGEAVAVRDDSAEDVEKKNIIKSYWEILKLRPVKFLGLSVILWALVCSVASSGPVYLMTNNMNLSAGRQSLFFTLASIFAIAWVPVINFLCKRFDKKHVYMGAMLIGGAGMTLFTFTGFPSFAVLVGFLIIFTFGNTTFWTLYYSLMYDINEVDEYVNGKRREGAVAALMGVCQKLGAAVGLQVLGIFLQIGGYGTDDNAEHVADMIVYANTILPGIIGMLAAVCIIAYPLTRGKYEALTDALAKKKAGTEYSEEVFEAVLRRPAK